MRRNSRSLGEDRAIPRRDFLQGALVGAATALTGPLLKAYGADMDGDVPAQDRPGYYPPLLTGLRGSHPGAFENAHALRDGRPPEPGSNTDEMYDLVVVGGGISGLSAAYFYRARTSPGARILILDNHDDFGGHAKRNEFQIGSRTLLLNGGTLPGLTSGEKKHRLARFGRIAIANSDAGAAAYTDSAIDQAHRAVGELLES
jgi:spermidine dehydrogenase